MRRSKNLGNLRGKSKVVELYNKVCPDQPNLEKFNKYACKAAVGRNNLYPT